MFSTYRQCLPTNLTLLNCHSLANFRNSTEYTCIRNGSICWCHYLPFIYLIHKSSEETSIENYWLEQLLRLPNFHIQYQILLAIKKHANKCSMDVFIRVFWPLCGKWKQGRCLFAWDKKKFCLLSMCTGAVPDDAF